MAVLNNPQGQVVNMQVTPNMQLQFGFDPGADAQLERVGDNLVFKFPDGGEIVLTGFYTLPVEELPKLDVQGAEITAQDFLASLGDDTLLPAAGPTVSHAALVSTAYCSVRPPVLVTPKVNGDTFRKASTLAASAGSTGFK